MNKIEDMSPLAMAFIGDAVHTLYVRKMVLLQQKDKLNEYHNQSKKFCNANAQSTALEKILPTLTDEEKDIVRKARNAKNKHSAKNCDEKTYKTATAFEALVGFLYLTNQHSRLTEILEASTKDI